MVNSDGAAASSFYINKGDDTFAGQTDRYASLKGNAEICKG